MQNRWMWMVMFVLGAVAATGVTWIMTGQPREAVADSPDRLGDSIVVTGNVAQGVNGLVSIGIGIDQLYLYFEVDHPQR